MLGLASVLGADVDHVCQMAGSKADSLLQISAERWESSASLLQQGGKQEPRRAFRLMFVCVRSMEKSSYLLGSASGVCFFLFTVMVTTSCVSSIANVIILIRVMASDACLSMRSLTLGTSLRLCKAI